MSEIMYIVHSKRIISFNIRNADIRDDKLIKNLLVNGHSCVKLEIKI